MLFEPAESHQVEAVPRAFGAFAGGHPLGLESELDVALRAAPRQQRVLLEHHTAVEAGTGLGSSIPDADYGAAGAIVKPDTRAVLDGGWQPSDTWGGLGSGMFRLAPFTNMTPEEASEAERIRDALAAAGAVEAAVCWHTLVDNPAGRLPPHWWDGERDADLPAVRVAAPGGAATAVAATQTLRPQAEQAAGPVNPLAALGGGDNSIWTPRVRAGANPTPNHLRPSWARDPSPNVEPYLPQRMFARQLTTGPDARAEAAVTVGPSRDVDRPGTAAEDVDMAID